MSSDVNTSPHGNVDGGQLAELEAMVAKVAAAQNDPYPTSPDAADEQARRQQQEMDERAVQEATKDASFRATDTMLGRQMAKELLDCRFCYATGLGWLEWNGRVWEIVDEIRPGAAASTYLNTWVAKQIQHATAGIPLAEMIKMLSHGRVTAILKEAKKIVAIAGEKFDAKPELLTVENGTLNLATGDLGPFEPDNLLTTYAPTAYRPGATHPDFTAVLSAMSESTRDHMQIRMGQAITGYTPDDDRALFAHGDGGNGKSLFLDAITTSLGGASKCGAATFIDDAVLMGDKDAKEEKMALRGARLVVTEELPEGRNLNVKALKKIVGTKQLTSRHLYRAEMTWESSHSVVITTNYLPLVSETDNGTWRRLVAVPFPYTYVTGEPTAAHERKGDPTIKTRLGGQGQREAALAWLVAGAVKWFKAGRTMPALPDDIKAATDAWRKESDLVLRYWDEFLEANPTTKVVVGEVYEHFANWVAEALGKPKWSELLFTGRFESHEVVKAAGTVKRTTTVLDGLSRPPSDQPGWTSNRPLGKRPNVYQGIRFRQT